MGKSELEAFLSSLATQRNVSAATQNQALSALLFLYRQVLEIPVPWLDDVVRAKKPSRLPTVLTQSEIAALHDQLDDPQMSLLVGLLYGSGLRLMEAVRLRVKDVELSRCEIVVRDGKGGKDRVTMLPRRLIDPLKAQIAHAKCTHQGDWPVAAGVYGCQNALALKYRWLHSHSLGSMYFPQRVCRSIRELATLGAIMSTKRVQRAVKRAVAAAGIDKARHTAYLAPLFRNSLARVGLRHSHRAGTPRPLGRIDHDDLHPRTESGWAGVVSPLDAVLR